MSDFLNRLKALRSPTDLQREIDASTAELVSVNQRLREEIDARQRTEYALRESEARFRATFENAAVGIARVAPDGRWLEVNDVLCDITGYPRAELLAGTFGDITHPDDLQKDWDQAHRLLAGEIGTYAMEKRYIRKDGSIVWVMLTVSLVRHPDGSPFYFISVINDITDRRRTHEALQEEQLRVRLALEASRAATWGIDYAHGAAEHFDARACELSGLDPSQPRWPAGTFCQLLHPEDRERMRSASDQTHDRPGPGPIVEYRIVHRNGQVLWLQGTGIVERDADGRARQFIGVSIDITERKRLEDELRRSIQRLADADRRKDDFLATLSHELRNPLAPIANGIQIIKLSASSDQALMRTAAIMERQLRHLVRLVDDLLDVSRIARGKVTLRTDPVQMQQVLAAALESGWRAIESGRLELIVQTDEHLRVTGDFERLTQVFSNILSNAAKYTPGEGKVWLSARREGGQAVVSVKDTGIGIPAEALDSVFEMFSQLRSSGYGEGGLGIGLALVRQLIRLHGGRVEARSEGPGRGSEFIVRLPALEAAAAATDSAHPTAHGRESLKPRRILVVEDDDDSAHSLSSLLQLLGHEVREAPDGAQAIEAAQTFKPDLIFMDIGLPRINGLEATQRIRDLCPGNKPLIVALTGWGQELDRERSQQVGIVHHLTKPIDPHALQEMLHLAQQA